MSSYFGRNEQIVLGVTPILTGLLSAAGSCCIAYIILSDAGRKMGKPYHRILLGMSVSDALNSLRAATSSFLMPADTAGVWVAFGNRRTCEAIGFFAQLGVATTFYSASLAVLFFLLILNKSKASSSGNDIPHWMEAFMHGIPIAYAVVTAFAGLFLDLYNPVELGIGCWIAGYPTGCADDATVECTRGINAWMFAHIFGAIPVIVSFAIILACMLTIVWNVQRQLKLVERVYGATASSTTSSTAVEGGGRRNESPSSSNSTSRRIRATSRQAQLYIGAFVMSYLWLVSLRLLENDGKSKGFFAISFLSQVFYPLQGFMNFFIYVRPRYQALKRTARPPDDGWCSLMRRVLRDENNNNNNGAGNGTTRTGGPSSGAAMSSGLRASSKVFTFATRMTAVLFRASTKPFTMATWGQSENDSTRPQSTVDQYDFDYVPPEEELAAGFSNAVDQEHQIESGNKSVPVPEADLEADLYEDEPSHLSFADAKTAEADDDESALSDIHDEGDEPSLRRESAASF